MVSILAERAAWRSVTAAVLYAAFLAALLQIARTERPHCQHGHAPRIEPDLAPRIVSVQQFRDPNIDADVDSVLVRCAIADVEAQVRTSAETWRIARTVITEGCVAAVRERSFGLR